MTEAVKDTDALEALKWKVHYAIMSKIDCEPECSQSGYVVGCGCAQAASEAVFETISDAGLEIMGWNMDMSVAPKDEGPLLGFDTISVVHFGDPKAGRCVITWVEPDEEEGWPGEWQVQPLWEGGDIICSDTNIIAWTRFLGPLKERDDE